MTNGSDSRRLKRPRLTALAAGVLILWGTVQLLATVPALHQALHHEAGHSDHTCFLTQFASGHGDRPQTTTILPMPPASRVGVFPTTVTSPLSSCSLTPHGPRPPPVSGALFFPTGFARV